MIEQAIKKIDLYKYLGLLFLIEFFVMFISGVYSVWLAPAFIFLLLLIVGSLYLPNIKNNFFLFFFILIPLLPLFPARVNSLISTFGVILISILWLFSVLKRDIDVEALPQYINYFLVTYLIICTLSTINSLLFMRSFVELVRLFIIFLFILVVFNNILTTNHIRGLLNTFIIVALLVTVVSLPEILTFTPKDILSDSLIKMRLSSFYGNANSLAIPYIFALSVVFQKIFYYEPGIKTYKRIGYFCMFLFFLYIVLLTNSRAALLYVLCSIFILMLGLRIGRIIVIVLFSLFVIALPFIGKTIFLLLRLERGLTGRDYLWKAAVEMISDYPWLGIGMGNYEIMKYKYILPGDFFATFTRTSDLSGAAHNLILTIASENGVVAGIAILFFLIVILYKGFVLIKATQNQEYKNILVVVTSILFGLSVMGVFESGIIIGSARINDFIYFLAPLVILARMEKIIYFGEKPG